MEVDASSGIRTNRSNFDLNEDNAFNDKDKGVLATTACDQFHIA